MPQVYGSGDRHHRLFDYLKRMDDGRRAILLGEEQYCWRWTRGYVGNVAGAIALTEAEWVRAIGDAAGWNGEIVALPEEGMPAHLAAPYYWRQSLAAEANRIRTELGYEEKISREDALQSAIEWERAYLPREIDPTRFDYDAEDLALEHIARRGAGLVCKE